MKTGRTLKNLAAEIERQNEVKRDFKAPSQQCAIATLNDRSGFKFNIGDTPYEPLQLFHRQLGKKMNIPKPYYDRMMIDAPELLTVNVNHWLGAQQDTRWLVRTLDGRARAFLSDRYRPLDNFELAEAVLPVLSEHKVDVISCEVTDTRMYIKAVSKRVQAEVKTGDVVQAGIAIRNSEVGKGTLAIEPLVYRLVCDNGMIAEDHSLRKRHLGRSGGAVDDNNWELLRDETREQSDKAFWMQVQDLTRAALSQSLFGKLVDRLTDSTKQKITGDPSEAIEVVSKRFDLNDTEKGGVLRHLIEGADLSRYGLLNAVTRHSQDVDSYDRATELESIGGRILELPKRDWKLIAEAN